MEASRLNVAVARLMELASATRKAIDSGPGAADPAVREAAETLTVLLSLFAPYTAEECWELLGREASVALAGWPSADPALLVEDMVTCVVQVAGKVRDRLEVPPGIGEDELRELALAAPGVARALDGAGGPEGDRPRAPAGQRRTWLRPAWRCGLAPAARGVCLPAGACASDAAEYGHDPAQDRRLVAGYRRVGGVVRHQPDVLA